MWDALSTSTAGNSAGESDSDLLPEGEEQKVIGVVKQYLQSTDDQADFEVSRKGTGYSVFVNFFSLDEQGRKARYVGGHCMMHLSSDLRVVEVIGGL
jgi:hypothetical protein